jgi:DNA-binding transcriptional ArsR family regulator
MNLDTALIAFSAISQETRLRVLKLLIEYGRDGAPAGALSDQLEIPHNSLSFHLAQLSHAGLVTSRKQGRSVIYAANNDAIQEMIAYLNENCCIREASTDCATDCKPPKSKTKRKKS